MSFLSSRRCFSDIQSAIQLILDAKNMTPDFRYLEIRLRLEQLRLHNWSLETNVTHDRRDAGFFTVSGSSIDAQRSSVLDTLSEIESLVLNFVKNQEKIGALVADESNTSAPSTIDTPSFAAFSATTKLSWEKARSKLSKLGLPQRVKWVIFYKERFEEFVNKIRKLNDALLSLTDANARVAIQQSTRETNVMMLHTHNRLEELIDLINASNSRNALEISEPKSLLLHYTQSTPLKTAAELSDLASLKVINNELSTDVHPEGKAAYAGKTSRNFLKFTRSDVQMLKTSYSTAYRCEAELQISNARGQRFWIEWREYDITAQSEIGPASNSLTRIEKLISLLSHPKKPDLLRVPRCCGYFFNCDEYYEQKYAQLGFILEMPKGLSATAGPISLDQAIKDGQKPSLNSRITLAKMIAECLMSLHSVNWLHKGLRSHNIIFFAPSITSIDYSDPYLSGFGYARPAFREDMTEMPSQNPLHDLYRHPAVHGLGPYESRQGFKRTFDIYSLGIVMMEIACWHCVDQILGFRDPWVVSSSTLAGVQGRLLCEQEFLNAVIADAGSIYRDATRSCLMGAGGFDIDQLDDETDVRVALKLSTNFHQKVLRPLMSIKI